MKMVVLCQSLKNLSNHFPKAGNMSGTFLYTALKPVTSLRAGAAAPMIMNGADWKAGCPPMSDRITAGREKISTYPLTAIC